MAKVEIQDKIKELYEEVRKGSKTKQKETSTDEPRVRTKPPSESKEKKKRRKIAKGEEVVDGPVATLKEIAYEHGLTPKELRRIIRKRDIDKPGGRWEWPADSKIATRIIKLAAKAQAKKSKD